MPNVTYQQKREELIDTYLKPAGITDPRVLSAISSVPREKFVPEKYADEAYENLPLPIGHGQTISQPSLVALMTQMLSLEGGEKVLEIGSGSGYQAAVLSCLCKHVYTIERIKELAEQAHERLAQLGYDNVSVVHKDGSHGYETHAPYDAIIVTAGAPVTPKPLENQLKDGGRIVIPVGQKQRQQKLKLGVKRKNNVEYTEYGDVIFVPLIGDHGWQKDFAWS